MKKSRNVQNVEMKIIESTHPPRIVWVNKPSSWSNSQYKSIGFRAAANSGDSSTCFGTPQLVVNTSSNLVLACYTSSGWVLATSPTTSISVYGYFEIRKLQLV